MCINKWSSMQGGKWVVCVCRGGRSVFTRYVGILRSLNFILVDSSILVQRLFQAHEISAKKTETAENSTADDRPTGHGPPSFGRTRHADPPALAILGGRRNDAVE